MLFQNAIAFIHLMTVIGLFVFLAAELALCRPEWLNGAVVQRLAVVDMLYGLFAALVLIGGFLRIYFGTKGADWYWGNSLMHAKLGIFVLVGLLSVVPTAAFLKWRRQWQSSQALPDAAQMRRIRRFMLAEIHLLMPIPLLAILMARGYGG